MLSATPWDSCDSGYKGCFPTPAGGQSSSGFLFLRSFSVNQAPNSARPHLQYCQASTPHLVSSLESFALKLGFAATVSHLCLLQVGSPVPLVGFFPARFPCFASRSVPLVRFFPKLFPFMFLLLSLCFLRAGKLFHLSGLAWALVDQRGVLDSFPFV